MARSLVFALVFLSTTIAAEPIQVSPGDWPWWRGPHLNGHADAKERPPLQWSESKNVIWKTEVPGRGHGSPTIIGDRVYLATADLEADVQSVLAFDRKTGRKVWQHDVHKGKIDPKGNNKASLASATVACDGHRLFVNFFNAGAIYASAVSLDGKPLWQTKICDFINHQGYGSSPILYQTLVLIAAENKGGGAIAGLDRETGNIVWKLDRPKLPNYTSPIIMNFGGRDQAILVGCDTVTSIDPATGKKLWETKGATTECVTSTVTDGTHIFTSGGYPKNHISAIKADGSGSVVWENGTRVYVPSMLIRDGHLYAVLDAGVATCWKCDTGKQVWTGRLGGTFSSSPVLVGEFIFATNETGKTFVYTASTKGLDIVAENQLGDDVFATPTFVGNKIYHRVAKKSAGKRQEWLYCIGKE